jgi:Tfp pilus assembly protein PilO
MDIIDCETRRFGRLLHYAGVLVAVVCATAGYSLLHAPTVEEIDQITTRINELKLSAENAPMIRQQHGKVSQTLHEVTTRIAEIQRRVPRDADAGEFLKEVTRLAGEERLAIKDFRPEHPEQRDGYAQLQVTLKGAGSYASICTFIDRLAKLKRLSKIKDLTLTAGDGSTEYPMTATLVIYFGLRGKDAKPAAAMRASPDPALRSAIATRHPAKRCAVCPPATTREVRRG